MRRRASASEARIMSDSDATAAWDAIRDAAGSAA
jgi:hypothetical protein